MSRTGFSLERAVPHEAWARQMADDLTNRGYPAELLAPDGDRPDIAFVQPMGETAFIDVKCPDGPNYSIKIAAFRLALSSPSLTLFVAKADRRVHTADTLLPRILQGPCRPTGNGSLTDWYLFERGGGAEFDDYFRRLKPAERCATYEDCQDDDEWHCPECRTHLSRPYMPCPKHPEVAA